MTFPFTSCCAKCLCTIMNILYTITDGETTYCLSEHWTARKFGETESIFANSCFWQFCCILACAKNGICCNVEKFLVLKYLCTHSNAWKVNTQKLKTFGKYFCAAFICTKKLHVKNFGCEIFSTSSIHHWLKRV